jgi:hypothetical protein
LWFVPSCIESSCSNPAELLLQMISGIHKKESSIFESREWQDFFENAASREEESDAHFWWPFFGAMTFIQNILKDARDLCSNTTLNDCEYMLRNMSILQRTENMYQALLALHERYQLSCASQAQGSLLDLPTAGRAESPDRIRLRHFLLYPVMFSCRLRASLSPSPSVRAASEEEAQKVAARALHIEKIGRTVDPNMAWHLAQRNSLPYSIVRTREDWLSITEPGEDWKELKGYLAQRWLKWDNTWHEEVLDKELGQIHDEHMAT